MDETHGAEAALGCLPLISDNSSRSSGKSASSVQCKSAASVQRQSDARAPHSPWLAAVSGHAGPTTTSVVGIAPPLNARSDKAGGIRARPSLRHGCSPNAGYGVGAAESSNRLSQRRTRNTEQRTHNDAAHQQRPSGLASASVVCDAAAHQATRQTADRDHDQGEAEPIEPPHRELAVHCAATRHVFSYLCRVSRGLIGWSVHDGRAWPAHGRLLGALTTDDIIRPATANAAGGQWARPASAPSCRRESANNSHAGQGKAKGGERSRPEIVRAAHLANLPLYYECACHKCGARGHMAEDCPLVVCVACQRYGHRTSHCPSWDANRPHPKPRGMAQGQHVDWQANPPSGAHTESAYESTQAVASVRTVDVKPAQGKLPGGCEPSWLHASRSTLASTPQDGGGSNGNQGIKSGKRRQRRANGASRQTSRAHSGVAVAHNGVAVARIGGWWSAMIGMDDDNMDATGMDTLAELHPEADQPHRGSGGSTSDSSRSSNSSGGHNNNNNGQVKRSGGVPPGLAHGASANSRDAKPVGQQGQQDRGHGQPVLVAPLSIECVA